MENNGNSNQPQDPRRDSATDEYFVFRDLSGADEFEDTFRLRYMVYCEAGLERFVRATNGNGFDFDAYDLRARHFGLFRVYRGTELPVGYLRVVEDRDLTADSGVLSLIDRYPGIVNGSRRGPKRPFPLMGYHPASRLIRRTYADMAAGGERLVEACHLALDPCFRSLRLAQHIVESALAAYFIHFDFEYAMWCCDAAHSRFYRLYGLRGFPGTIDNDFLGVGHDSSCLLGGRDWLPARMRKRIARMADAYGESGRIACFPNEPFRFTDRVQPRFVALNRLAAAS